MKRGAGGSRDWRAARAPGERGSRRIWPQAGAAGSRQHPERGPPSCHRGIVSHRTRSQSLSLALLLLPVTVWDGAPFQTAGESGWAPQSPAVSVSAQKPSPAGAGGARGPGESLSRDLRARTPAPCRCGGRMGRRGTFCSQQPSARLFLLLPSELACAGPHPRPGGALRCLSS